MERNGFPGEALRLGMAEESAAMTALAEELAGSGRPMVAVSGTPWVPGRASTEADPLSEVGPVRQVVHEPVRGGTSRLPTR